MAGALVVGQLGGPTAVINASLAGIVIEARKHPEITAVYGMIQGVEGLLKDQFIDLTQLDSNDLLQLERTPGAALGSSRYKVTEDDYLRILEILRKNKVPYLTLIGGNGTMTVCQRLHELGGSEIGVVGVPKTIDNDLAGTDFAPGYPSAARFLALAARDSGLDLEAMTTFDDVIILETFGRNTGWLAASSALLKQDELHAPHLVYVPEIAFDETRFLDEVMRVHQRLNRCFVVVAEGIKDASGSFVGQNNSGLDALGRIIHSFSNGVAVYLSELVREKLNLRCRFLRPNLIGRVSSESVSVADRREAREAGRKAVELLTTGHNGVMVGWERITVEPYSTHYRRLALNAVAGIERTLPREYMDEAGTMITQAFRDYAMPLIGAVPPIVRLI